MAPDEDQALPLAAFHHEAMKQIAELMQQADDCLRAAFRERESPTRRRALTESFHRGQAWAATFSRLTEPGDLQARAAGTRTLFEIVVDLSLLHLGDEDEAQALIDYEDSQRLAAANTYQQYLGVDAEVDDEHRPLLDFIARDGARIAEIRQRRWKGIHPPRWTGNNLRRDARLVDERRCQTCFGSPDRAMSLEELYASRLAHMNWLTHGSGAAGRRKVGVHGLNAMMLHSATLCAYLATRVIAHEFTVALSDPGWHTRFTRFANMMVVPR
jgi:hypothetical protein